MKRHWGIEELPEHWQLLPDELAILEHKPVIGLIKPLRGKIFGDRGYIGHTLSRHLRERFGIELITKLRRNMKNRSRIRKAVLAHTGCASASTLARNFGGRSAGVNRST